MRTHTQPSDPGERDIIDDMLAGIAGYLGCKLEPDRPRYGGLRALVEATIFELAEQAATRESTAGLTLTDVADLLYACASAMWASNVVECVTEAAGPITDEQKAALAQWLEAKQAEERQGR